MNSNKNNKAILKSNIKTNNKAIIKDEVDSVSLKKESQNESVDLKDVYADLMSKAEKIKIKSNTKLKEEKYDYFKIKNIIKENLKEHVKENPYQKERYSDYLKDDEEELSNKHEKEIEFENDYLNNKELSNKNNYNKKEYNDENNKKYNNEFESIIYNTNNTKKTRNINNSNNQDVNDKNINRNILKDSTDERVSEINNMEINLLNQAKALENQISDINKKRMNLIIKEFRDSLSEESNEDLKNFYKLLNTEYNETITELDKNKTSKLNSINDLHSKINDSIDYLRRLSEELKVERIDLNASYEAYLYSLDQEKKNALNNYKIDQNNFIENRVKIFRQHLEEQMNGKK